MQFYVIGLRRRFTVLRVAGGAVARVPYRNDGERGDVQTLTIQNPESLEGKH